MYKIAKSVIVKSRISLRNGIESNCKVMLSQYSKQLKSSHGFFLSQF